MEKQQIKYHDLLSVPSILYEIVNEGHVLATLWSNP